jgi:hypothetical protein
MNARGGCCVELFWPAKTISRGSSQVGIVSTLVTVTVFWSGLNVRRMAVRSSERWFTTQTSKGQLAFAWQSGLLLATATGSSPTEISAASLRRIDGAPPAAGGRPLMMNTSRRLSGVSTANSRPLAIDSGRTCPLSKLTNDCGTVAARALIATATIAITRPAPRTALRIGPYSTSARSIPRSVQATIRDFPQ